MHSILIGIAFAFVIEGLFYAVFPGTMRRIASEVQKMPESTLRVAGVVVLAMGVAGAWLTRFIFGSI